MVYAAIPVPAVGDQITAAWGTSVAGDLNSGPNQGTPRTSAATGTVTTAGTETRDAVLGDYTFTAVAGRRYRVELYGLLLATSVAGDLIGVRIRDGGGATPTAASTLCASNQKVVAGTGGPGQEGLIVQGSWVPGAGVRTLSVFTVRLAGTGVETPLGARELFVVDIGPA